MSATLALLAFVALRPAPKTLRVLAVFNLSGPMASVDRPGLDGMRLAAEELSREGPLKVQLVPVDGESNPAHAANAVRNLLRRRRFDAVAGLYDSDYALAVGRICQNARVPFVTSGATLPGLPARIGRYVFTACYNDDDQAKAMARFAWDYLRARSTAVIAAPQYAYTKAIATDFPRAFMALGGKWLMSINDTTPGHGKPLKFGSDCVYAACLPDEAGATVKRLRNGGYDGPILSGDGFDTPSLYTQAGMAAYKVFFTTHVAYDSPDIRVRSFVKDYVARYRRAPDSAAAALAYDTLRLIADAKQRAGHVSLRDAIAQTHGFNGVTGDIGYTPGSREPSKPVTVVELLGNQKVFRALIDRP